jgi:hypothetical protein
MAIVWNLALAWVGLGLTVVFGALSTLPPVREWWERAWSRRRTGGKQPDRQRRKIVLTVSWTVWIGLGSLLVLAAMIV